MSVFHGPPWCCVGFAHFSAVTARRTDNRIVNKPNRRKVWRLGPDKSGLTNVRSFGSVNLLLSFGAKHLHHKAGLLSSRETRRVKLEKPPDSRWFGVWLSLTGQRLVVSVQQHEHVGILLFIILKFRARRDETDSACASRTKKTKAIRQFLRGFPLASPCSETILSARFYHSKDSDSYLTNSKLQLCLVLIPRLLNIPEKPSLQKITRQILWYLLLKQSFCPTRIVDSSGF